MIRVSVEAGEYEIGTVCIERVRGTNDFDNINTYKVDLRLHNIDTGTFSTNILHRYGDQWPVLVSQALSAVVATISPKLLGQYTRECPHHD